MVNGFLKLLKLLFINLINFNSYSFQNKLTSFIYVFFVLLLLTVGWIILDRSKLKLNPTDLHRLIQNSHVHVAIVTLVSIMFYLSVQYMLNTVNNSIKKNISMRNHRCSNSILIPTIPISIMRISQICSTFIRV